MTSFDSKLDVSELFRNLEHAAAELWAFVDGHTTFKEIDIEKMEDDDVVAYIEDMRELHRSSTVSLQSLQAFVESMNVNKNELTKRVEKLEDHITKTSLSYELKKIGRAPKNILAQIFVFAAETLEEKVALSLVCKRIRSIITSMQSMWDGYCLEIGQTPEQMVAIAEGNRASLKADFSFSETNKLQNNTAYQAWANKRGLDPNKYADSFYKLSLNIIRSLRPEQLKFYGWLKSRQEELEKILASMDMQPVRSVIIWRCCNLPFFRWLENWHPSTLPGPTTERNLVRFELHGLEKGQLSSMRSFLASAKFLQVLRIVTCVDGRGFSPRYYEVCDLPLLGRLDVNFIPHPSIGMTLLRLTLQIELFDRIILGELLGLLSSAVVLQEFSMVGTFITIDDGSSVSDDKNADSAGNTENTVDNSAVGGDNTDSDDNASSDDNADNTRRVMTLPNLIKCEIRGNVGSPSAHSMGLKISVHPMGRVLIAKLSMPALRRLTLQTSAPFDSPFLEDNFRSSFRSYTSLQELEVEASSVTIADLEEIMSCAPPQLESFSIKSCESFQATIPLFTYSSTPHRRLIRFARCKNLAPSFSETFAEFLKFRNHGGMQIEFDHCEGWRDGTFGLDELESAWLNGD